MTIIIIEASEADEMLSPARQLANELKRSEPFGRWIFDVVDEDILIGMPEGHGDSDGSYISLTIDLDEDSMLRAALTRYDWPAGTAEEDMIDAFDYPNVIGEWKDKPFYALLEDKALQHEVLELVRETEPTLQDFGVIVDR